MKSNSPFNNNKIAIYSAAFFLGFAGMIGPLSATHMAKNGVNSLGIGALSSLYFVFSALCSLIIAKKLQGKNILSYLNFGLFLTACCDIIFPMVKGELFWAPIMCLMGIGMSFSFIGLQTSMHNITDHESRATVSGIYFFFFAIGFIIGTIVGSQLYELSKFGPYFAGALTMCIAIVLIQIWLNNTVIIPLEQKTIKIRKNFFGLQGAFIYGFTETTLVTLFPAFLINHNYSVSNVGMVLGIFVTGIIMGTMPMSYAADRYDRKKTMLISGFFSIFSMIGILYFDSYALKLACSFICGILIGPIYPISLAISVDGLSQRELSKGTSLFTFSYSFGSAVGPFLSALAMKSFGSMYIFSFSILFFILMILESTFSVKWLIPEKAQRTR